MEGAKKTFNKNRGGNAGANSGNGGDSGGRAPPPRLVVGVLDPFAVHINLVQPITSLSTSRMHSRQHTSVDVGKGAPPEATLLAIQVQESLIASLGTEEYIHTTEVKLWNDPKP